MGWGLTYPISLCRLTRFKVMKPQFSTLVLLTFVCAALLSPFVFSGYYLPALREQNFDFYQLLQTGVYKQATGFTALGLVLLEILLALRKRGRRWQVALPGSVMLWRSTHIFVGVSLIGVILVHTFGATGHNYNGAFLWVFFAVSLSPLVGATTETGILGSRFRYFRFPPLPTITKGPLIRSWRSIWLGTHIFLVSIFSVMLGFHTLLAYYY